VEEGGQFNFRQLFQNVFSGFRLSESSAHKNVFRNTYCVTMQPR
jgi:hypothetical protein